MRPGEGRVLGIAGAILDGNPIDWAAAERGDVSERDLFYQLRLLAAVADMHRHPLPPSTAPKAVDSPHASTGAPTQWGHLHVFEAIGRGAFGAVYRAWDTRLDREVALKLLPAPAADGNARASSIIEEGRLLARVRHPNVVTIYGADRIGGRIGIWMELVEGQTLEEVIRQRSPLPVREVVRIGIELAHAVAAVHAAGLLHRDIKAQNAILTAEGRVVLMDFGTGREMHDAPPEIAGTPLYLAPELLAGATASIQSDIYSLGVLLYHLLTGSYPVHAAGIEDLRRAHARRASAPLCTKRRDVAPQLARIVEWTITADPAVRCPSAATIADALERLAVRRRGWPALAALGIAALVPWVAWDLGIGQHAGIAGTRPPFSATGSDTTALPKSVAVLPFKPFVGKDANEAVQLGMTEAVISQLARVGTLRTIPFARVRRFGGADQDPQEAGRTLGVDAVLEGHSQQTGDRLQIRWRLIRTHDGSVLAADEREELVDDMLQVPGRLAASLVQTLEVTLSPEERERMSRRDTNSPEAFRHYLFGRYHLEARSVARMREAERQFRAALSLDPAYARAHAGLSFSLIHQAWLGGRRGIDIMGPARDAALEAVAIDDSVALAHTALALVYELFEHDPMRAQAAHLRAMVREPEDLWVLRSYSFFLLHRSAFDEALELNRRILDLDPTLPLSNRFRAQMLYFARRYDECIEQSRQTRALDPQDVSLTLNWLPLCLEQQGRRSEAVEEWEQARALRGDAARAETMKRLYAAQGWDAYWREQLRLATSKDLLSARAHVRLGNAGAAIDHLERLYEGRHPWIALTNDPEWDPLRADPRFQALRQRAGLSDGHNPALARARAAAMHGS